MRGQVRNELENALAAQLPRMMLIEQPTSQTNAPPNLLDVDQLTDDKIRAMFARGEEFAKDELSHYSFSLPSGAERQAIEDAFSRLVQQVLSLLHQTDNQTLKLRTNIYMPQAEKLILAYSYNMGDDQDRELEFDYETGLTGFCFLNRRPFLCNLRFTREWAKQIESSEARLLGMKRDDHLAVREDRNWLASVPIFDPVDCWFLDTESPQLKQAPGVLRVWSDLPGTLDGALFGVLNMDAAMLYADFCLSEDPASSLTNPRIASIFNALQACSFDVARIFSQAFARKRAL